MKYNMKNIMTKAWEIFRKAAKKVAISFAEALHRAWQIAKVADVNAQIIRDTMEAEGITEECHQWYGWKMMGREVAHESKCLFQCVLLDPAKGDGATKVASFFGLSQTVEVA